ncbi:ribonuclease-III-like-domain-containing protein [Russula earlei]|uniref:Ribonuclease-III-like-domain-containing protein n=1 Tax=Russula earlei TaxID=71964 RepID=A0ACC0UAI1_9AGAM|nr:ribonuclease-III-like-domain-containing protein [Russula earlei]
MSRAPLSFRARHALSPHLIPTTHLAPPSTLRRSEQKFDVSETLAQYLNGKFAPLQFPPALAQRILTHISHRDSAVGHNSRFAFLGRRTLEAYFLLFLQGLPAAAEHDHARIAARVLHSHCLGAHVAPHWGLEDVMRWVPPHAGNPGLDGRAAGVHKVAGTTVEAIVGGVLHQFGGSVTHRLFHTRVLPYLLLPGSPFGLPDVLHADALKASERYGGLRGPLLFGSS